MSSFNNDLVELLETRDLLILENWAIFKFNTKKEEIDYIKRSKYDLQKHYTFEWDEHIIINLDFDTIKPFVRYTLRDVYKSLEYKALTRNLIVLIIAILFILMNVFNLFGAKSLITENNILLKEFAVVLKNADLKLKPESKNIFTPQGLAPTPTRTFDDLPWKQVGGAWTLYFWK